MTVQSRRGFTLMEVMVGLTVSLIVITTGFATLYFVNDRSKAAELTTLETLSGAVLRDQIVDWVSQARLQGQGEGTQSGAGFTGTEKSEMSLDLDELTVPTTARTPINPGGAIVRLLIDRADSTPERGLVAEFTEKLTDTPKRIQLLPQASSLDIYYLPPGDEKTNWVSGWTGRSELPRAIEIRITAKDGDSLPMLLRRPIRVTLMGRQ